MLEAVGNALISYGLPGTIIFLEALAILGLYKENQQLHKDFLALTEKRLEDSKAAGDMLVGVIDSNRAIHSSLSDVAKVLRSVQRALAGVKRG